MGNYTIAIICFAFSAFCLCMLPFSLVNKQKMKEREEKQKKIIEEYNKKKQEQRNNEINSVKQFAGNHGFDIKSLLKQREDLYNLAVRNYATGKLTTPLKPTTVKANYSGSIIGAFGDYRAEQINNERQQQYNDLSYNSQHSINVGLNYHNKYKYLESKMIEELKKIPNSEKYVAILEKYFKEDDKIFR